jgi:hypothetical protein
MQVPSLAAETGSCAAGARWCERLLALCRNAVSHETTDIERFAASGLLAQVLSEHKRLGHDDPRCVTRSQLIEDKVPIAAAAAAQKKARATRGPSSGFVHWMKKEEAKRKKSGTKLSREEYLVWQQSKGAEFNALPVEKKTLEMQEALKEFEDCKEEVCVEVPLECPSILKTVLDDVGNTRTPFTPEAFEHEINLLLHKEDWLMELKCSTTLPCSRACSDHAHGHISRSCIEDRRPQPCECSTSNFQEARPSCKHFSIELHARFVNSALRAKHV